MKALILAGGFGVRLREIVHGRPKHLAPVSGEPFLRLLTRLLKKRGVDAVIISVGYLAHYIIDEFTQNDEGMNLKFSEDNRPLGTAGSLKNAQRFFKDDFLLINGDTYLDIDYQKLLKTHQDSERILTVVGTTKHKHKGGLILSRQNRIINFIANPDSKTPVGSFRNTGVYAVSPRIFKFIPAASRVSLEKETIPLLLKRNQPVGLFPIKKSFIDIGSPESYQEAIKNLS